MTSIFVAKLDFGITSEQLKEAFQQYGTVLKATVATDRETGKSRGFGFVEMADKNEAQAAIKGLDGSLMNGRPIAVKEAEQRPDNRPARDNNSGRPDFNRNRENNSFQRPSSPARDNTNENRRPDNDGEKFTPPVIEPLKGEPRKKENPKEKKKDWDTEGKAKKPKMNAYKKSGKGNRFFDDDDDLDDLDNASFFNFADEDDEENDD
jgi:RNA recognition motif-containing protein